MTPQVAPPHHLTIQIPTEYPAAPLSRTILRFRCPYCGRGAVLAGLFATRERCAVCGFVFNRGNPAYFSGAIFINYLLGAGASIAMFLVVLAATWPRVPWNVLAYAGPVGMLVIVLLLYPVSKMILLAVDVRMRPITESELIGNARRTGDAVS
jgi:uncharacterized protein (DUF983 family)